MLSKKLFLKEWLLLISTIAAQRSDWPWCFVLVACHIAKGGLLNVIGKEINSLKQITELKASFRMILICWKATFYIDHFGNVVTNISKRQFIEFAKGRPYEIIMRLKTSKPFYQITLQLPAQINIRLRIMKEKNWLF
jgi:hypothetical protein